MKQRRQSTQSQSLIPELAGVVATLAVPVSGSLVQQRTPVSLQNSESSCLWLAAIFSTPRRLNRSNSAERARLTQPFCLREPIALRHTFHGLPAPPYWGASLIRGDCNIASNEVKATKRICAFLNRPLVAGRVLCGAGSFGAEHAVCGLAEKKSARAAQH